MGIIVEGFAGTGKTTMAKKYDNVFDLNSSDYHWIYEDKNISEKRKGNDKRILNPEWPDNYIKKLFELKEEYDIVLAYQSIKVGQRIQYVYGYMPILCYPSKECKEEYLERYRQRGNNEEWMKMMEEHFDEWIELIGESDKRKIVMKPGEGIEDALIREKIIEKYIENGIEKIKLKGDIE